MKKNKLKSIICLIFIGLLTTNSIGLCEDEYFDFSRIEDFCQKVAKIAMISYEHGYVLENSKACEFLELQVYSQAYSSTESF